jgi:hypothetical protein
VSENTAIKGDCNHSIELGVFDYMGEKLCRECYEERMGEHNPEADIPDGPKTFQEAAVRVAAEWATLLTEKQMDYGPNNILGFGEKGLLVREWDKINRLKNLLWDNPAEPNNESLDDTWRDIGGYALIAVMLKRGWFTLPLDAKTDCTTPACNAPRIER